MGAGTTRLPELVGIINLTPDSFSDGGAVAGVADAVHRVRQLMHDGATVIDVGAESTRPNAVPLTAMEEWMRLDGVLQPIIEAAHAAGVRVSVDTRHAAVAERALECGVDWINDVGGLTNDAVAAVVAAHPAAHYVVTHSLSVPADPNLVLPATCDVVDEVLIALSARVQALAKMGIDASRIILDPGIGFGKTAVQSLRLLHGIARLQVLGCELLVGHSRKSFLACFAPENPQERDAATLAASLFVAQRGVEYLRVHDVAGHRSALAAWKGLCDAPFEY